LVLHSFSDGGYI